jgi:hypothetical protein
MITMIMDAVNGIKELVHGAKELVWDLVLVVHWLDLVA